MEIIIEETFIINFLLDLFILKITSKICKKSGKNLFSALFGALITLFVPLIKINTLIKVLLMLCIMILMIVIAFKFKNFKEFILLFTIFMLATFLFGGGCYALKQMIGNYSVLILLLSCGGIYLITIISLKIIAHLRQIKSFTYKLTLKDRNKVIEEEGYLDSGNVLYDCITKKPIVLINYKVFHKLYENISYLELITQKFNKNEIKNAHFMKINSVGKSLPMLIFTVDELSLGGERNFKNVSLGLSFSGFEKSFGKNILLHCDYA